MEKKDQLDIDKVGLPHFVQKMMERRRKEEIKKILELIANNPDELKDIIFLKKIAKIMMAEKNISEKEVTMSSLMEFLERKRKEQA